MSEPKNFDANKILSSNSMKDTMAMDMHLQYLQDQLQETRDELFALVEVCTLINSVLDVSKLIEIIMEMAKKVLNAEASSLMLIDEKTGELVFKVAHGEVGEKIKEIRIPQGKGIAGWVAQSGKSLLISDVTKDSRFYSAADEKTNFKTRSIICAPLISKEKTLGIVEVLNKRPGKGGTSFTENDLRLLEALANQSAVALENAVLYEKLSSEKRKIETIVNSMRDAVIVTDHDFSVAMANPAAEKLFPGASSAVESGGNLKLDIILNELTDHPRDGNFDVVMMKPESAVLSNSVTLMRDQNDQIQGAILAMRNITDPRERQRAVAEFIALSSNQLKDKVESMPPAQALQLIDHTLKFIYFNEIEGGPIRLDRSSCSMGSLVSKVLEKAESTCSNQNHRVPIWSQTSTDPDLNLDRERISHIIERLIAVHGPLFTNFDGHAQITEFTETENITLSLSADLEGVHLSVKGIPFPSWISNFDPHFSNWNFQSVLQCEPLRCSPLETAYFMHVMDAHGGQFIYDIPSSECRIFIPILKEIQGDLK
ncbi:MAG: hypothetical protein CVV64_05600 [Candidatus Wallbacteria bacterium HGW-Wallbacteria-1]|jgi:putative methionine-R-sulfoxide reductase with GAF domain|uniref:GAF domain-containing protein n=1 Tax=Candidatus Wallbacteria bacterium HGW-Wallbacteria-1 TaxID=2013854 RepID=A0A2N1PSD3_9BACT|nr:MAG: hypothetical protein CVV64_05600 [Candidatus Wallbacteria bacterium HGW-Wallbacteria-1]